MDEAKASWNTFYLDRAGFECQLTLRDDDEAALAERVASSTARILEGGGTPVLRRGRNGNGGEPAGAGKDAADATEGSAEEKTYLDRKGIRRCNLTLKNGKRCNQPVTEREGRYGWFWSCPNFREHQGR